MSRTLREQYEEEHRRALAERGIIANGSRAAEREARNRAQWTAPNHRPLDPWQSLRASAQAFERGKHRVWRDGFRWS